MVDDDEKLESQSNDFIEINCNIFMKTTAVKSQTKVT